MSRTQFTFGANSVTKIIEVGYNILSFTRQYKCKGGWNTVGESTYWGRGTDAEEMVELCTNEIISSCMTTKGITNPVGMSCLFTKEGETPRVSNFPLFGTIKKGYLTAIPKDVAFRLVEKVENDKGIERLVRGKILNYDDIMMSVKMNKPSLSEYLETV